jgi:glyoxylate reductase
MVVSVSVAVAAPLPGRAQTMLAERFDLRVHRGPQLTNETELAEFIGAAHGVLTLLANPVTAAVLAQCRSLRVVGNVAVGFDNVDLAAAERRGVWVTNTPDVLTEATADLTWALILAVTRRLVEADAFVRQGRFEGWDLDLMLGAGLQHRTLGIVGYGRIGRAVARRALPFGMTVVYHDQRVFAEPDPPARCLALDDLLATAHVVSLHTPLNDKTHHLLNESRLRAMLPGAILINTARGPLVDEDALVRVLAGRHLAGAGLDVYEHEPAVHPGLIEHPHVVLLPHVGSATVETRAAMAELAAKNVIAVLEGRDPPTPVVRGSDSLRELL